MNALAQAFDELASAALSAIAAFEEAAPLFEELRLDGEPEPEDWADSWTRRYADSLDTPR